jgi:multidrug transporter EmrE-like cation transporter
VAPELLILFPISIACDVVGQVFFKLGADRLSARAHSSALTFSRALLRERWLLAGIATFAVETIIWLRILSLCPLSIAFPIAALNFIGVTLAARVIFAETISAAQWVGCGLVTVGVAVLAAATVGPT